MAREFSIRALLILILGVACFFGGIHFERERKRRENQLPFIEQAQVYNIPPGTKLVRDKWGRFKPVESPSSPSQTETK